MCSLERENSLTFDVNPRISSTKEQLEMNPQLTWSPFPQLWYFLSISPFPRTLSPQNCEYANPQMPHFDYQHHHFHFVVSHSSNRTINSSTLACTFGSLGLQNSTLVNMIPFKRPRHYVPILWTASRHSWVHSSVAYVVGSSVNIYDYAMLQVWTGPDDNAQLWKNIFLSELFLNRNNKYCNNLPQKNHWFVTCNHKLVFLHSSITLIKRNDEGTYHAHWQGLPAMDLGVVCNHKGFLWGSLYI